MLRDALNAVADEVPADVQLIPSPGDPDLLIPARAMA
jgi:hypothetical protein